MSIPNAKHNVATLWATSWSGRHVVACILAAAAAITAVDVLGQPEDTGGELVPLFPAASAARQGFVRVVNNADESGTVQITAVDDAGTPADRVGLSIAARQTVHFNSDDLERGNAAKGLS